MSLTAADDEGTVTVRADDVTVVRYRAETAASKPHVDVLALPPSAGELAGRNLVLAAPHDHQWHLGLFFCQKLVDGVNCWESELYETEGRPHGYAEDAGCEVTRDGGAVVVSQEVTWRTDGGEQLLADRRSVTVHEPTDGGYLLTWDQELEAVGGTRRLSSETVHGHYSGLAVRFTRSMTNGRVLLPGTDSPDVAETTGPSGEWCDYTGGIDGRVGTAGTTDPWRAGVTLMADPANDPHPVQWFTAGEIGFVAANPTFETVRTVPGGESVSWRWGLRVHEGAADRSAVESAYERFVAD